VEVGRRDRATTVMLAVRFGQDLLDDEPARDEREDALGHSLGSKPLG
jgi:hypothetical protein